MSELSRLVHPWPPVFREDARVLILGTFPSPKSRAFGFYFGHPQNVFWQALARALGEPEPARDAGARRDFLLANRVALWDVLHACDIAGASDASIRNPVPNRFRPLIERSRIRAVFTTGRAATRLFDSLCQAEAGMPAIYLPSTSPANRAAQRRPEFDALWARVRDFLQ
jgi:hypoxanthine-DNA glycosylase